MLMGAIGTVVGPPSVICHYFKNRNILRNNLFYVLFNEFYILFNSNFLTGFAVNEINTSPFTIIS